jgi:acetyl-CoA decarbonylase/synthase complex subunit gamma
LLSLGYPTLGVPAAIWAQKSFLPDQITEKNLWEIQYQEVLMGMIFIAMDLSLIILHTGQKTGEIWALLALMTFRQNIFTDPRIYPAVEPGLYIINQPDEWSPIYITSNYRMTKIPVEQDLIDAKLDGYLLVVDTGGIGIESATAGGQFNEDRIKKAIDDSKLFNKVHHRTVIIPGMSARLQQSLSELINGDVLVGPRDSSAIPDFIVEHWKVNEIKKKSEDKILH